MSTGDESTNASPKPTYWAFYWPLALMALAMVLVGQVQNGVLARYPHAVRELAIFALATGTFQLFAASMGFVSQMVNVLARNRRDRRVCLRFTLLVCLVLTIPPAFLSLTGQGKALLGWAYNVEGQTLDAVVRYLRYLLPVVLMAGVRQYYTGLLIQIHRTGWVTALTCVQLAVVVSMLLGGLRLGWPAVETLAVSMVAAAALHMVLTYAVYMRFRRPVPRDGRGRLHYGHVLAFFWPMAVTSIMFSLTRPLLYSYAKRAGDGEEIVAALRVAFTFGMVFHMAINQFRHLFVTFGRDEFAAIRKFMVRVLAGSLVIMVLILATPLSDVVFRHLLGLSGDVETRARQALWVLCAIPVVAAVRNYFHGLSMVNRRTGLMAAGALMRNVVVWLGALGLYATGRLTHVTGAAILVAGFVAETVVVSAPAFRPQGPGRKRESPYDVEDV